MSRPRRHPLDPEPPSRRVQPPPSHHQIPQRPAPSGSFMPHHQVPYYNSTPDWRPQAGDDRAFKHHSDYNTWLESQPRPPAYPTSLPPFRPTLPPNQATWDRHQQPNPRPMSTNGAGPSNYHQSKMNAPRHFSTSSASSSRQPSPAPSSSGKYVPLHLRAPLTGRPPAPSPSDLPPSFGYQGERRSPGPPPAFTIPLPDEAYMKLSTPNIHHRDASCEMAPKLLVLDLNGTLIFRNKGGANSRTSYPRPYLGAFLAYLFRDLTGTSWPIRPWEVFVWSSAQPHNVRAMLESTFDAGHIQGLWDEVKPLDEAEVKVEESDEEADPEDVDGLKTSKVLGVWARDKMGLSKQEYAHKTQTTKDLRKVEAHFGTADGGFSGFPLHTILLLDDSPLKAVHQPWNQLVLPEYDRDAFAATKLAVQQAGDEIEGTECDQFLLAVIGILEATAGIDNLPAWIRAGGLKKPDIQEASEELQSAEWEEGSLAWRGEPDGPAAGAEATLESLPSHEDFEHWFQDSKLVKRWIEKGKAALEKYGIPLVHGIDPAPSVRSSPAPPSRRDRQREGSAPPLPIGHTVPASRQRGYSPSQPTTPTGAGDRSVSPSKSDLDVKPRPTTAKSTRPTSSSAPNQSRTQTRQFGTTANPIPDRTRPFHVDTWRTFTPADVAEYLSDICSRPSLSTQDRNLLRRASRVLSALKPEDLSVGEGRSGMEQGDRAILRPSRKELRHARNREAQAQASISTRHISTATNGRTSDHGSDDDWIGDEDEGLYGPDYRPPPRTIVPDAISSQTRGAQTQSVSGGDAYQLNPETTSYPNPPDPPRNADSDLVEEEPESPNAQYPLNYITHDLDLGPLPAGPRDHRPLTNLEIARYMARAKTNPDPTQRRYMKELKKLAKYYRTFQRQIKAGTKKTPLDGERNRMKKLRRFIIEGEQRRDSRNAQRSEREGGPGCQEADYVATGLEAPPPGETVGVPNGPPGGNGVAKKARKSKKEKKAIRLRKEAEAALAGTGGDGRLAIEPSSSTEAGSGSRSSKRQATDDGGNSAKVQRLE